MGTRLALVRAAVALVVLALGVVAPARGAIDANGKWSVRAQGTSGLLVTVACLVDIAQSYARPWTDRPNPGFQPQQIDETWYRGA